MWQEAVDRLLRSSHCTLVAKVAWRRKASAFDPPSGARRQGSASTYAVDVDQHDQVWLTDFEASAIVKFASASEYFTSFPRQSDSRNLHARQ